MAEPQPGYPKSIIFLVGNEFCERFNYYGLRAILGLYVTEVLLFSEHAATLLYHTFAMMVYLLPLLGAIIADSWLGKFKTILYLSMVYVLGNITFAISTIKQLGLPARESAVIGLLLIAIGTGGIKPCVAAFGGDQFDLPLQSKQFDSFFHLFYFAINAGSLTAVFLTPLLRKNVHCFGEVTCYPLAFIVPGMLMVVALVLFISGKPLYKINQPQGNMVLKVTSCICTALKLKCKSKGVKKDHWLDFATEKHGEKTVNEIKILLRVLYLYMPLPLFWALFEQQATGWTFQARRMNGEVGDLFTILPDQMLATNPCLVLIFIPLFNYVVYPLFAKCSILVTPLQRIATGGLLAGCSFILTAFLAIALEATFPVLPAKGNGQLRIYNIMPCEITITSEHLNSAPIKIPSLDFYAKIDIPVSDKKKYSYSMAGSCATGTGEFVVTEEEAAGYIFNSKGEATSITDSVAKLISGDPAVRPLVNLNDISTDPINIKFFNKYGNLVNTLVSGDTQQIPLQPGTTEIHIGDSFKVKEKFAAGGVYVYGIIATAKDKFLSNLKSKANIPWLSLILLFFDHLQVKVMEVTEHNYIHMLWLLPQYIIITAGEIMLSISGLEFSYAQAPTSMKSVLQAGWLLTVGFGQLFVVLLEAMNFFSKQSHMFFLYSTLMIADMGLFSYMAMGYKYVQNE